MRNMKTSNSKSNAPLTTQSERDNALNLSSLGQKISKADLRNNDTNREEKISMVIKIILWLVIFSLPLFFMTNTPSILELGKQSLLIGLVGVAFLLWVGRMAIKSQIKFRANFIFIPIFIFLFTVGLSTVFADYISQSTWGFFGGEARSFITLIFFVAFFVLFVNNIKTRKDILKTIYVVLASGVLVTVFGLLQLWGKYLLPIQGTYNFYFNTVGSIYLFGVYVSALFMIAVNTVLYVRNNLLKIILVILSLGFFAVLTIISLQIIWIALIISLALVLARLTIGSGKNTTSPAMSIMPMIFLVLALLMVLHKQPIIKKELPIEVLLSHETSASIAWKAIKHDFLLGSGPANYVNVYREFRPMELGNFWSTNFNTASSYFLTLASTVGALGTLAFISLVVVVAWYMFRGVFSNDERVATLVVGIGSVWTLITICLLFYVANITVVFFWWLMLALLVSALAFNPRTELREFSTGSNSEKPSLLFSFVFVLIIIGVIVALYMQGQKYIASVYFHNALIADAKNDDVEVVVEEIDRAILANPSKDLYYRNRSLAFFAMANKRISEKGKDFTAEDAAYVSKLIQKSLGDADMAKKINPHDVDNVISLGRIYESLLPTMEGAGEKALKFANEAIEVDPNNPNAYKRLATIYITMADLETVKNQSKHEKELPEKAKEYLVSARESIKQAIELKPDLLATRLLLVGIFDRERDGDGAINAMMEGQKVFPTNPNLAFQLGILYLRNDKLDEAENQFAQAIRLDNNYANAYYFLGLVLDKKGQKKIAIKAFEKVLDLNKGNELVEKILRNLKEGRNALENLQQSNSVDNKREEIVPEGNATQPNINPVIDDEQVIPENAAQGINIDETQGDNNQDVNNQGDIQSGEQNDEQDDITIE